MISFIYFCKRTDMFNHVLESVIVSRDERSRKKEPQDLGRPLLPGVLHVTVVILE